ncbi:MAG: 30S ribosomal protein S6e, partial [Candidatus Diapherotrites archaeon]|nr:30S ribosomal protein S6e [Candidatus Diapherotrites archaeon]
MKMTIANPGSGKTYQKELEAGQEKIFLGKKIGTEVKLDNLGLSGIVAVVTGGSDKQGFPMRRDVDGSGRK